MIFLGFLIEFPFFAVCLNFLSLTCWITKWCWSLFAAQVFHSYLTTLTKVNIFLFKAVKHDILFISVWVIEELPVMKELTMIASNYNFMDIWFNFHKAESVVFQNSGLMGQYAFAVQCEASVIMNAKMCLQQPFLLPSQSFSDQFLEILKEDLVRGGKCFINRGWMCVKLMFLCFMLRFFMFYVFLCFMFYVMFVVLWTEITLHLRLNVDEIRTFINFYFI